MGILSSIKSLGKSLGSKVCGAAKKIYHKTVEFGKKVVKGTVEVVKKTGACIAGFAEKFTGRDKEREAEELLAKLEEKAKRKEKEFQQFSDDIRERINAAVDELNDMRKEMNGHDFRRFEELASLFGNWDVATVRSEMAATIKAHHLEPLKSRGELFKIDFRNHPVSSNLKAIFTLGFLTRKRAKETLLAVREEEHRLELDIKQLETEKTRLNLVAKSLEQVVGQIAAFHAYYGKLLNELDYSVNLLRGCYYIQTNEPVPDKLDAEMLPLRHRQCLECADKATRILYTIGNFRFVSTTDASIEKIQADFDAYREKQSQLDEMQQKFAA